MRTPQRLIRIFTAISIGLGVLTPSSQAYDWLCERSLSGNHRILEDNRFRTNRAGVDYIRLFRERFVQDVSSLPYESHWLDSGAGQAIAMHHLAEGFQSDGRWIQSKSRGLTALSFKRVESPSIGALTRAQGRQFRYLEGRYLEDYSLTEIGLCDLITDVYGPFAYSARIDLVLRKYLEVLKIGGTLYIQINPDLLTINNASDGLGAYLRSIKGVRVEWVTDSAFRIEKTAWTQSSDVPELRLEHFMEGQPPNRKYGW